MITLEKGHTLSSGIFELTELYGFMHESSRVHGLPWNEVSLLPRSDSSDAALITFLPGQVRAWSEYYRSSFYISGSAGRGAYGEVWRAIMWKESQSRKIVLKRIYSGKGLRIVSSCMREVYYGSMFGSESEHISRFITHFVEDNDLWVVFYDEGISLYQALFQPVFTNGLSIMYRSHFWDHLRQDPTISSAIIKQVLQGLVELHSQNITHRDLKLENVFIDPSNLKVRLGDLGSAVRSSDDSDMIVTLFPPNGPTLAEETGRYAPPEREGVRMDDILTSDPSFDMWCLGIMWLEMTIGSVDLGLDDPRDGICVRSQDCSDFGDRVKQRDPLQKGIEDSRCLNLISDLLSFDPSQRPTASEALNHPCFSAEPHASMWNLSPETYQAQGGRSDMEDRLITVNLEDGKFFACVFDGHNGAGVASFLANRLPELVRDQPVALRDTVSRVTEEFDHERSGFGPLEGSTLCCALIDGLSGHVEVANIGDSRLVISEQLESADMWRPVLGGRVVYGPVDSPKTGTVSDLENGVVIVTPDGQENKKTVARNPRAPPNPVLATQITVDHKPDNLEEIEFIEKMGGFVSKSVPARLNGILAISRSVGSRDLRPMIRSEPDFFSFRITRPGKLIIATDGVWDVLSNQQVAELGSAKHIVQAATAAGGRDNMALVVVSISPRNFPIINEEL